jgi:hypothetical protein
VELWYWESCGLGGGDVEGWREGGGALLKEEDSIVSVGA